MSKSQPKPITPFLANLQHSDYKIRREAVKNLGKTRNPDAYAYLISALSDLQVSVVIQAIRGIELLADTRAIPVLLAKLGGSSCDVCDEIGSTLTMFGAAAVPALLEALNAEHPRVRAIAATCLSDIGDPVAITPLINLLNDTHPWPLMSAIGALWDFDDPRACDALAAFLERPDASLEVDGSEEAYNLKREAAFVLADFGDARAIDTLAQSFDAPQRLCVQTIQQLGEIDSPRVRPLIQRYIDEDPESLCASQARATLEHLTERGL